jgi:Dockerin type I domain
LKSDFNAIATNFGKTGATFSQGDFNYDGKVDAADFALLVQKFNTVLPSAPVGAAPAQSSLFSSQNVGGFDQDVLKDGVGS